MNTSKFSARRLMASAAALPLLIGGLSVTAGAADATANACIHPSWQDKDSGGTGTGNSPSTPVRSGPSAYCGVTANVGTDVVLHYHCFRHNEGATWTAVRINGTEIHGWVKDSNLDDYGSIYQCG